MTRINAQHRTTSASANCDLCGQVMRNIEVGRSLTPSQARHMSINSDIIRSRVESEILVIQPELALQGDFFDAAS